MEGEQLGDLPLQAPRQRRIRGGQAAAPGARYIRPARVRDDGRVQRPRVRYFPTIPAQRKYYGIKHQIGFQRQFPLRDYTYIPLRRGSDASLEMYGASHRLATPDQRLTRARNLMTGRGLYKGRGGYWGRAFGNLFGLGDIGDKLGDIGSSVISNVVPGGKQAMDLVSSDIGQGLGNIAANLTGSGMYKRGRGLYRGKGAYKGRGSYEAPITNGLIQTPSVVPQFGQNDMKSTTITNREFIGDVYAPLQNESFSAKEYPLNPGMRPAFAWLSQLAINYEEYELNQLIITYKSTVTDFASTSGQVGQIIMATQYNPTADPFGSKEEMMLYEGGMSCKTTEHMQHGIECDPAKLTGNPFKYVRIGDLPLSEDLKEYDLGRFCMAITGVPAAYAGQVLGELWISYTVTLRKPKVASGHAYNSLRDFFVTQYNTHAGMNTLPVPSAFWLRGTRNSGAITVATPPGSIDASILNGYDSLINDVPLASALAANTGLYVQFHIDFADWFEGCVSLRITHASQMSPLSGGIYIISSDQPAITTRPATIFRFKDIPVYNVAGATKGWGHMVQTIDNAVVTGPPEQQGTILQDSRRDVDLHLRIMPAQAGVKNRLTICWSNSGQSNTAHYLKVEINQYNTFLSETDNGRGVASLLLKDVNGNPFLWQ